jgi:hypothetical protein
MIHTMDQILVEMSKSQYITYLFVLLHNTMVVEMPKSHISGDVKNTFQFHINLLLPFTRITPYTYCSRNFWLSPILSSFALRFRYNKP